MRVQVLFLVASVVVAHALGVPMSARSYGTNPTLPQNYSCGPHMGLPSHGPMPIQNLTGWWYLGCNAHAAGFGEVDILFGIFESWIDFGSYQTEQLVGVTTLSMPGAPAGKRYHSLIEFAFYDSMPWQQIPIDLDTGAIHFSGSPNAWDLDVNGTSEQGKRFELDLNVRQYDRTVHMGHNAETGCVDYIAGVPAACDIFYWSTLSYNIGSGSKIKLPGKNTWSTLTGTCHYDRQHKSATSTGQWKWGEATLADNLPAGWEELEGGHLVFWGLFFATGGQDIQYTSHIGIKYANGTLVEFNDIIIATLNTTYHSDLNITISDDLLITMPSLEGKQIRVTATVPEAIVNADGSKFGTGTNQVFLESPCLFRVAKGSSWNKIGYGYLEVTSGYWKYF